MFEDLSGLDLCLGRMTDREVELELFSMKNLALWLYRNDEGIPRNSEYVYFHQYLKMVRKEALKRENKAHNG